MGDPQPWGTSPKSFRAQFVADFSVFLRDQNHTPQYSHMPLSQDDIHFLSGVSRFVNSYVNVHRGLVGGRHKLPHSLPPSDNYTMVRFINQKDDPFTGVGKDQVPVLVPPVGDPRDSIERAHSKWRSEEYTDVSLTATTQECSSNKGFKTIASHTTAAGFRVESAVGDLHQGGPSSRGDASRTGSLGGVYHKDDGGSRARDRCGRRFRPEELPTANQGLPGDMLRRASAGSRVSTPSRRERKMHVCPDCHVNFRFDARLKSHMAVHRKPEEKLLCPHCGSGFGRESSLKRHQNTPSCEKKKNAKMLDSSHSGPIAGSSQTFDRESTVSCHGLESEISTEGVQHDIQYPMQPGSGFMSGSHAPGSPIGGRLQNVNDIVRQYDNIPEYYHSQGPGQSHPARNLHRGTSSPALMWDPNQWLIDGDYQRDPRGGAFECFLDLGNEDELDPRNEDALDLGNEDD